MDLILLHWKKQRYCVAGMVDTTPAIHLSLTFGVPHKLLKKHYGLVLFEIKVIGNANK